MTDTAQEQSESGLSMLEWSDSRLADALNEIGNWIATLAGRDGSGVAPPDAYDAHVTVDLAASRLRARQREDGDRRTLRCDNCGEKLDADGCGCWSPEDMDAECATCGGDGNISTGVPGVEELLPCPDCATPQREGEREPVAWEERLAAALASALASAELVRRRGNEPDWWRCVACWEEGRGPGRIEHEPDCPEAVYGAWKADTEPPAEREPEPNVIPNTDLIREWIKEYEHFSTEGGPDYYPDLAAFIHDQIARRATAIRFNVQPAEPPAKQERDDSQED